MSIFVVTQEFETATLVNDKGSASGKSIIWPSSPTAKLVHDEGSASGKSIVWSGKASCASMGKTLQASVVSTRANSPVDSGSEEDVECDVNGDTFNINKETVRNAILGDLGVELETCDSFSAASSSTTAGSPYPSSVATSPYLSSAGSSPGPACTPPCALKVTGTRPPVICTLAVKDASHRSPGGFLSGPRPIDASQRTPLQTQGVPPLRVAQRISGGLRRVGGCDASERRPAPVAGASWASAANCVAATRAAATSCPMPAQAMPPTSGAFPDAASLAQVALAAADAMTVTQQVSTTTPSVAVSFVAGECFPQPPAANVEVCPEDALKCWLAGSSSLPSGEDLEAFLRAAQADTYDD